MWVVPLSLSPTNEFLVNMTINQGWTNYLNQTFIIQLNFDYFDSYINGPTCTSCKGKLSNFSYTNVDSPYLLKVDTPYGYIEGLSIY